MASLEPNIHIRSSSSVYEARGSTIHALIKGGNLEYYTPFYKRMRVIIEVHVYHTRSRNWHPSRLKH